MLQLTGNISTKDIVAEFGKPLSRMNLKLDRLDLDKYIKIDGVWTLINKCSQYQPSGNSPFTIKSWYGYDHSAQGVTNVQIEGKTKILPGATIHYNAIVTGPNIAGITLMWETHNGTTWSIAGYGPSIDITWGNNPNSYKIRVTVIGQCQGGTSQSEKTLSQKTTYYNLITCGVDNGVVRQTHTVITTVGQNVFWGSETVHFWDGTITDTPTDYVGEVTIGGDIYCGDTNIPTYYVIKRCSDNALFCTTTKIGIKNQRVKDSSDVLYTYTGETRKSATYTQVNPVTILHEKIRCNDPIGDQVYWNLSPCQGQPPAQTPTPLPEGNLLVIAGQYGIFVSTGTTTVNPTNDIGEVNYTGIYGCDGTGSPSGIYSILQRCSDGALFYTSQTFSINGQRVTHGTHGNMFWNGGSTNSPGTLITVSVVDNMTGCPGSGGSTTYYQLRRCGFQSFYYTTTNPGQIDQRVSSGTLGELVFTGGITTTPGEDIGPVTIITSQYGCSNEGGQTEWCSNPSQRIILRDNCTGGDVGSAVNVSASYCQFTSTVSQEDADAQRDAWMQNYANTNGTCTTPTATYYSKEYWGIFFKDNCPTNFDSVGNFPFTLPAGYSTSNVSQNDADSQAWLIFNSLGQSNANSQGTCVCNNNNWRAINNYCIGSTEYMRERLYCWETPQDQYRDILVGGCTSLCSCIQTYYSVFSAMAIQRDNCATGYTGSYVYAVAEFGQFTSTVSQEDADAQRDAWMQNYANTNGACNPIVLVAPNITNVSLNQCALSYYPRVLEGFVNISNYSLYDSYDIEILIGPPGSPTRVCGMVFQKYTDSGPSAGFYTENNDLIRNTYSYPSCSIAYVRVRGFSNLFSDWSPWSSLWQVCGGAS